MTPWLDDGDVALYHGSAIDVLRTLPASSVQTCITSPPYWGLRDYQTASWEGGDAACPHVAVNTQRTAWANSVPGPAAATGKNAPMRNETALVARKHGRHAVGIDLSADYLAIAARRLGQQSLFAQARGAG